MYVQIIFEPLVIKVKIDNTQQGKYLNIVCDLYSNWIQMMWLAKNNHNYKIISGIHSWYNAFLDVSKRCGKYKYTGTILHKTTVQKSRRGEGSFIASF